MLIARVGSVISFTNRNVFETTSEANKCVFVRKRTFFFFFHQAVLTVYQLGTFSDRGNWIHHNLQGTINIVIIAQKKD